MHSNDLDPAQALIGLGTTIAAAGTPVLAGIGLSTMFLQWIGSIYTQTHAFQPLQCLMFSLFHRPEALRCLMGYICDLTLIMDHLFLATLALDPPRRLTLAHIDNAVETYRQSSAARVHTELRKYANHATLKQVVQFNKAEEKVKELIGRYCLK